MTEQDWYDALSAAEAERARLTEENARWRDGFAKLELGCKHLTEENARLVADRQDQDAEIVELEELNAGLRATHLRLRAALEEVQVDCQLAWEGLREGPKPFLILERMEETARAALAQQKGETDAPK